MRRTRIRGTGPLKTLAALAILAVSATGCTGGLTSGLTSGLTTVEPWERGTLASDAMSPEEDACKRFEFANEVYREGAVGANGGKAGGGCGCT